MMVFVRARTDALMVVSVPVGGTGTVVVHPYLYVS